MRPPLLKRFNPKLVLLFLLSLAAVVAQDPTSYLTPAVTRIGDRLACRCGGCRNTVGNCPMLRCHFADPMRQRISEMQKSGATDDGIVNTIVREEGIVALSAPPAGNFGGLITWIMPAVALVIGFLIYSRFVRRNQQTASVSEHDQEMIERYRSQIDTELLDDEPGPSSNRPGSRP